MKPGRSLHAAAKMRLIWKINWLIEMLTHYHHMYRKLHMLQAQQLWNTQNLRNSLNIDRATTRDVATSKDTDPALPCRPPLSRWRLPGAPVWHTEAEPWTVCPRWRESDRGSPSRGCDVDDDEVSAWLFTVLSTHWTWNMCADEQRDLHSMSVGLGL